jgi:hypothetical protein
MPLPGRYNLNGPIPREILEAHPAWLFAYDEEGTPGQSEATIKPNDLEDPALPGFVVADVHFADGTDALALVGGSFGVASSDDLDELRLYLGDGVWEFSLSFGSFEQQFPKEPFIQTHANLLPMQVTGRLTAAFGTAVAELSFTIDQSGNRTPSGAA